MTCWSDISGQKFALNMLPTGCVVKCCLRFSIRICVTWNSKCKADCVAAECTDPGLVSNVKRLSLFCIVEDDRMKESKTPDSKTRFFPKE